MKTLIAILFPIIAFGQIHLMGGVVDIQDRMDGSALAWDAGYTQFLGKFGMGANFRSTQIMGDGYYTLEGNLKYRVVNERIYRMDISGGVGWNLDESDIHPVVGLRNAVRIDEGTWLTFDFDNSYRNSQDFSGGGWRFETYLLVGLSLDVKWQKNLKRKKRFF